MLRDVDVSEHQGIESFEVLDSDGYIEIARTIGAGLPSMAHYRLTDAGFEAYATTFVDGYDRLRQAVLSRLAGWASDQGNDEELARQAEAPRLLALHILKQLDARGLLRLSQPLGPWAYFHGISPKLRRMT
jgi:DNA-binding PadR family transcriptional regulator